MKAKNILITALSIMLSVSFAIAQPTIQWQKSLGGSDSDIASSIKQTNDGGFIVAGYSNSNSGDVSGNHGGYDYWVAKLSSIGTIEWQKSLGGTSLDMANSIQQTDDGGYIVAGITESNDGDVSGYHFDFDSWVVKLSSIGTIEWQKCLGGFGSEYANSIHETNDGGYIVAGISTESNGGDVSGNHGFEDLWVVKLTSIGTIEWQKTLGGTDNDEAQSIQQTNDGGYIVAGRSNSNDGDVSGNHGNFDYWVVKLTSIGAIEWQKSLGGSEYDDARSIQQTNDGGFIVAGTANSNDGNVSGNHGYSDSWLVKLTSIGVIEWQKSIGGTGDDVANFILQTNQGGYIVAGYSSSNDGDVTDNAGSTDYWVLKLTSCLLQINTQPASQTINLNSNAQFIVNTSDPLANFQWQSDFGQGFQTLNNYGNYSGVNTNSLSISNVQLANHAQPIRVISTSGECIDTSNVAIINITDTCIVTINDTITTLISVTDTLVINTLITGLILPNNSNTIKVFPNPANSHITIDFGNFETMNGYTLTITNSIGQTVYTTPINEQSSYVDLSTWSGNGIYFVQIIDTQNNTIENRKIVLQ